MSLAPGTRLGPYEIVSVLGKGGMGEVYRARDPRLNRDVAIKTSREEFNDRFLREARAIAALNHPNICHLYDVGPNYLVMELVEGPTLEGRGPTPLDEVLHLAAQIASALEAAHEKAITHRDLKPANIKLTPDGVVKVLDFGLARIDIPEPADPHNAPTLMASPTIVGTILGTAAYMAPEQARGKVADKRADIWAFGVVLYELITGKRLFEGETISDVLASVLKHEPDLSAVPVKVRRLIAKCLEKEPKKRLRDVGDWEQLLTVAEPSQGGVPASQSKLKWRWAAVAASVILLAAVPVWMRSREPDAASRILQYTIPLPEGATYLHSLALSPDGKTLAMSVTRAGKGELWLRRMDQIEAHAVRGAEEGKYPFWSPDGRWVGFFAQGKLKKVAAGGGPAETLCDSPSPRGATWGPDRTILFADANLGAILRVPDTGGKPEALPLDRGLHKQPQVLPGDQRVLYWLGNSTSQQLHVTRLNGRDDVVMPGASSTTMSAAIYGGGYILQSRENTLMATPFDASTGTVNGEPVLLAESVAASGDGNNLPASTAGTDMLVYKPADQNAGLSQLSWFDRSGKMLEAVGAPGVRLGEPAISPDGLSVAFAREDGGAGSDIWIRDLARGTETRLTAKNGEGKGNPHWSPSGNTLDYRNKNAGFLISANGQGKPRRVYATNLGLMISGWTPDGKFLIYNGQRPGGSQNNVLWLLPVEGKPEPKLLAEDEGNSRQCQVSPDGRWLTYVSDASGRDEIYVRPFPAGAGVWRVSTNGGDQPRWRGDGKEIFYIGANAKLTAVTVRATTGEKLAFEAAAPVELFETRLSTGTSNSSQSPFHQYAVSADGKKFLLNNRTGPEGALELVVMLNWRARLKK